MPIEGSGYLYDLVVCTNTSCELLQNDTTTCVKLKHLWEEFDVCVNSQHIQIQDSVCVNWEHLGLIVYNCVILFSLQCIVVELTSHQPGIVVQIIL